MKVHFSEKVFQASFCNFYLCFNAQSIGSNKIIKNPVSRTAKSHMVEACKNYVIWLESSTNFFYQFSRGEVGKAGIASFMSSFNFKACSDTAWTWWDLLDTACRAYFIKISI